MKDIECPSEFYVIDPVCPWKDADATHLSRKNYRRASKSDA
jgi:hypothetical protein